MVGGEGSVFMKEGYSEDFAPDINKKVWKAAKKLGYGKTFMDGNGGLVTDDHLFINRLARIKTIDIIPTSPMVISPRLGILSMILWIISTRIP